MGKVFMALFFFASGTAVGFYYGNKGFQNEGNSISVSVDGKVKKGSEVNINLEDVDQDQEKNKKKKWFNK